MSKRYRFGVGAAVAVMIAAGGMSAGDLTPPGPPGSTMRTLQEIYDKIEAIGGYVGYEGGDAAAGEILAGKKAWVGGAEVTGTMPNVGQQNVTPGTVAQTITQGYHDGTGTVAGDTNLVAGNIKAGTTIFDVTGTVVESTGDATAAQVLSGATFSKTGEAGLAGTMPNVGQQNVTPGTAAQAITQGYHDGTGSVAGDANLAAGNIKKDVTIFGVTGTHEGEGGGGGTYHAGVPKTGAGALAGYTLDAREDGATQLGVVWPTPRFTDNNNGTVADNLTGLVWLKNANAFGTRTWANALADCAALKDGDHGLTDGSTAGDWRLPNVRELQSLIDYGNAWPTLPSGHPFTGFHWDHYWSSSTHAGNMNLVWYVNLHSGIVNNANKANALYVWPVRGGQ